MSHGLGIEPREKERDVVARRISRGKKEKQTKGNGGKNRLDDEGQCQIPGTVDNPV